MKKILGFVILLGFVIMIGAAGSADASGMSFAKVLVFEMSGLSIVLFGTSALMHYKRYLRRTARIRRRNVICAKTRQTLISAKKELA